MRGFTLFLTIVTFGTLYWNYRVTTDSAAHYAALEKDTYTIGRASFIMGCIQSVREQLKIVDTAGGKAAPLSDEQLVRYCDQRAKEFLSDLPITPITEESESE